MTKKSVMTKALTKAPNWRRRWLTSHQRWVIADEREIRNQILPSLVVRAVEAGLGDGVDGAVEDDEHPRRRGEVEVQLGEVCGEADGSVRVDLALEADDVEPSLAPLLRDAAEVEDLALEEARLRCAEVLRKVACPAPQRRAPSV